MKEEIVIEKAITNLGTKELHKRHTVMVEGGRYPRAKVIDQHICDRYLMRRLIDLKQHRASEYLLQQAAKAGSWPVGVNLSSAGNYTTGSQRNYVPFGAFPFGRSLVEIRKRYGEFAMYIVRCVITQNRDVSKSDYHMECLRNGLDWVADRRMNWSHHPIRYLQRAVKKKAQPESCAEVTGIDQPVESL